MSTGNFLVSQERYSKAQMIFLEKAQALGEVILIEIAGEIGLSDFVSFSSEGKLRFDFTQLQWVAMAAAVVAAAEMQAKKEIAEVDSAFI